MAPLLCGDYLYVNALLNLNEILKINLELPIQHIVFVEMFEDLNFYMYYQIYSNIYSTGPFTCL